MASVVSDIIVSPARVFVGAVGATPPADSVAAGASWGASWAELGFTNAALSFKYSDEQLAIEIEQSLAAVDRVKTKEELAVETMLAELNLDNVAYAIGSGSVSQTAAGVGQVGKEEFLAGGSRTLTKRAWGFEGSYVDEDGATFPIRVFVWKAVGKLNGALEFNKTAVSGVPLQLNAVADMTKTDGQRLFKIQKVLEPAT